MTTVTTTIRVSANTRKKIYELAHASSASMQQVIDQALELFQRHQLLTATNEAYAALREDTDAWRELQNERDQWDSTLSDGLENC